MAKKGCNFLELAKSREMAYEFSGKEVSDSDLNKILEAGRWAPSSLNTQNWKFIVVKNKKTISMLMKTCYYGYFHTNPPVMIAIVMEPAYINQLGLTRGNLMRFKETHQYMNISLPAMNMQYESMSLGIGSCILSAVGEQADKILGVPKGKETVLFVGVGYEKKDAYKKPRARKQLSEIAFNEKYPRK